MDTEASFVTYFENTRVELAARRSELARRIESIEDDLDRHGARERAVPDWHDPAGTVLHDFMGTLRRELGLVESVMRRIDSREYDCCMQCGTTIKFERLERLPYAVNCESCSSQYPVEYIHQLRGQHSSLRRTIFAVLHIIEDTVGRCRKNEATESSLAPTLALMADLARQLPERFQIEEKGGYLSEALAAAPRFSNRATRLVQQHRDFSHRTQGILKEAESAAESEAAWVQVHAQFRELSLDVLNHEQAEADILESAFLDDLGGVD
jgi:RNA polymerase-binding transcription factor DksA